MVGITFNGHNFTECVFCNNVNRKKTPESIPVLGPTCHGLSVLVVANVQLTR